MALPSPATLAEQPVVPSVPEPQPAQGPSKTILVLPQLHEARAPRGKVLPPPLPGQPKAKRKVAWVRAPMQPLPQLGYNTRMMPVLKPKMKNLQQPRPAYLTTMPHGAHDLSPPVDQPYKPKTTLIVMKDYVHELVGRHQFEKQIEEKEKERAIQAEMQDLEAQQIRDRLQQLHLEELRDLEKKQLKEREAHTEDFRINEQMLLYKEQKLEQERLADQRVLDYQKEKMAREADFEAQQEKARHEKELETARLRALQERAQDLQAEKDAVRAKRHQEAKE
ncbi:hypothetical protein Y1Q_0004479 [Alligator mississippiensis]|uniref:Cilia- and flagella-associated protein 45 n=1 Tax=Alligator mississippiensis TaxID=8496 RepID=A0A151NY16_ALLMI|nr:hypothetical protein Y1Q_0004479 [Alligator mississippiensis]